MILLIIGCHTLSGLCLGSFTEERGEESLDGIE